MDQRVKLMDGDLCDIVAGAHKGKSGMVADVSQSKTGTVTITVQQEDGQRFRTPAENVVVK